MKRAVSGRPPAVQDEPGHEQRPVKGAAVERGQVGPALQPVQQMRERRRLFSGMADEQLLHAEDAAFHIGEADQEREIPRPDAEPRGFQIEKKNRFRAWRSGGQVRSAAVLPLRDRGEERQRPFQIAQPVAAVPVSGRVRLTAKQERAPFVARLGGAERPPADFPHCPAWFRGGSADSRRVRNGRPMIPLGRPCRNVSPRRPSRGPKPHQPFPQSAHAGTLASARRMSSNASSLPLSPVSSAGPTQEGQPFSQPQPAMRRSPSRNSSA